MRSIEPSEYTATRRLQREDHPERVRQYNATWQAKNPGYVSEWSRAYRERDPEAYEAHKVVRCALRSGALKRPDSCTCCLAPCVPDAHHRDHARALDVDWLCRRCHRRVHAGLLELIPAREVAAC